MRGAILGVMMVAACGIQVEGPPATDPAPRLQGANGEGSSAVQGELYTPVGDDLSFDAADGTRFNLLGQAFEGPHAGTQLGRLPGMTAFWFAWSSHHPGARVWPDGTNLAGDTILSNAECGVPCEEMITGCRGGKDCIPSIDRPVWVKQGDVDQLGYLTDDDRVLGLTHGGGARAYPLDALWTHEIVNDTWDGWEFSLTYCPLTGSGIVVDGLRSGDSMRFGVSGRLFNSNLVLYDRSTDSLYGQMRQVGVFGDHVHDELRTTGVIDTTWGTWRRMFPETEVLSERVGIAGYPYGDYRTDHTDTFIVNTPRPAATYPLKSYAIGVVLGGETVIYPFDELAKVGPMGTVSDEIGGVPVVVAFDLRSQTAAIYDRRIDGEAIVVP